MIYTTFTKFYWYFIITNIIYFWIKTIIRCSRRFNTFLWQTFRFICQNLITMCRRFKKLVEILNNFVLHYLWNDFYQRNNLSRMLEVLIFLFLSPKSSIFITSVSLTRLFSTSFILAMKLVFVNLLNSWVLRKWLISGVLFSIYVAFVFKAALVARTIKIF